MYAGNVMCFACPAVKYSAFLEVEGEPHKLICWFLLDEDDGAAIKMVIQQIQGPGEVGPGFVPPLKLKF